jgi:hypothetical protein
VWGLSLYDNDKKPQHERLAGWRFPKKNDDSSMMLLLQRKVPTNLKTALKNVFPSNKDSEYGIGKENKKNPLWVVYNFEKKVLFSIG